MPPLAPEELANNRAFQLMTAKSFPWSREVWALTLDKLFAAGARLVMFDFVFNPPNEGDPVFHETLEKYRDRVVLAANIDMVNHNEIIVPNEQLIQAAIHDDRVGYVNFWPNPADGILRAALFTISVTHISQTVFVSGRRGIRIVFGARSGKARTCGRGSARSARSHDSVQSERCVSAEIVLRNLRSEVLGVELWQWRVLQEQSRLDRRRVADRA